MQHSPHNNDEEDAMQSVLFAAVIHCEQEKIADTLRRYFPVKG